MNLNAFSFMEDGAKWRRIKRALNCIMNFSNFFLWFLRNCRAACSGPSNLGSWQCDWASPGDLHRNGNRGLGRLEVPSEWWVSAQESYCWGLSQFLSEPPGCPVWLLLIKNHSEIGTDLYTRATSHLQLLSLIWWGGAQAVHSEGTMMALTISYIHTDKTGDILVLQSTPSLWELFSPTASLESGAPRSWLWKWR